MCNIVKINLIKNYNIYKFIFISRCMISILLYRCTQGSVTIILQSSLSRSNKINIFFINVDKEIFAHSLCFRNFTKKEYCAVSAFIKIFLYGFFYTIAAKIKYIFFICTSILNETFRYSLFFYIVKKVISIL